MKKYVIFDVDGTLNQTTKYAIEAYKRALKKRGIIVADETIIACIGLSPEAIIKKLFGTLDKHELKSWQQDIIDYEFELMVKNACAFDGMKETLEALINKGYHLAICSNAYYQHIEHVLKTIGLWSYFSEIGSLEMGATKVETLTKLLKKIKCDKACLVGDRKFDLEAARANHISIIGCGYGYGPSEIQEADYVVSRPLEILDIIDTLI